MPNAPQTSTHLGKEKRKLYLPPLYFPYYGNWLHKRCSFVAQNTSSIPIKKKEPGVGGRRSYEMTLFEDKQVKKSLYNFTVLKVYRIAREIYFVYSDKMHIYNLKLWWSRMTEFSKSMLYLLWNHQRNKTSLGKFQIWSLVHQHSTMTLELELWQNFTSI